jgi:hypothetical protein
MNGSNKLECYIKLCLEDLPRTTLWPNGQTNNLPRKLSVMNIVHWLYSQQFIFFITYEWVQQARVFFPGKPFQTGGNDIISLIKNVKLVWLGYKERELRIISLSDDLRIELG